MCTIRCPSEGLSSVLQDPPPTSSLNLCSQKERISSVCCILSTLNGTIGLMPVSIYSIATSSITLVIIAGISKNGAHDIGSNDPLQLEARWGKISVITSAFLVLRYLTQ